jgi:hypothetical protein
MDSRPPWRPWAWLSPPQPEGGLRPNYLAASAAEDKLKAGLLGVPGGKPETSA